MARLILRFLKENPNQDTPEGISIDTFLNAYGWLGLNWTPEDVVERLEELKAAGKTDLQYDHVAGVIKRGNEKLSGESEMDYLSRLGET